MALPVDTPVNIDAWNRTSAKPSADGVLAIIMVLELKVPHGTDIAALKPLLPVFLSYVLSFIYLGIYWNHHHQLDRQKGNASQGQ